MFRVLFSIFSLFLIYFFLGTLQAKHYEILETNRFLKENIGLFVLFSCRIQILTFSFLVVLTGEVDKKDKIIQEVY